MTQPVYDNATVEAIASHYREILKLIGENPDREGLADTPMRAAKALCHATSGYSLTDREVVGNALFSSPGSGMVTVKDIEFYSLCEHHILPFFGKISVGYIPDKKILGISKLARLVDLYARRLQVQERLCEQVCNSVMELSGAKGVMVRCEGRHLCMQMRGVEKQDSSTVTIAVKGVFENDPVLRSEFLSSL